MSSVTTILIVDDKVWNRNFLEEHLQSDGFATLTAASGEQALALIAVRPPDLILLDTVMPGMDGYQVASTLKSSPATTAIPIIMMTAQIGHRSRLAQLQFAAEEFLTRPIDRAELNSRVRTLLRLRTLEQFSDNHNSIVERKVRERTAELQHYRAALDAVTDAIFVVNRTAMRYVGINAAACRLLGFAREDLLQADPAQVFGLSSGSLVSEYDSLISGRFGKRAQVCTLLSSNGVGVHVELHRQAMKSGSDWIIVDRVRNIVERKEFERCPYHMAHYDSLTGLPNRNMFYKSLARTLVHASERGGHVVVLLVDLDRFRGVNDTFGHAVGDELLLQISARLTQCVRSRDTICRLDGDEFALILVMQDGALGGARVAGKVRDALRAPICVDGGELVVTASIGIAVYPDDASDAEALLKYADTALCRAKLAGRDTFVFYTERMNSDVTARIELEAALRKAVENEEFVLQYQPKMHLKSGRIAGVEALLRWHRPGVGLVPPNEFIPALEESGLIVQVGRWVIAEAGKQIGKWMRSSIGPIPIAVNISGRQFVEGDLELDVLRAIEHNAIAANLLELELTESSLMANTERTIATLQRLKHLGVAISIDDFGTGYSSLAYLRSFPIDKLKIDIAFVRDITSHADGAAIALAKSLKLGVIAEGVETAAQMAFLRKHGCDEIQGYFFSQPLPVAEIELILANQIRKCAAQYSTPMQKKAIG